MACKRSPVRSRYSPPLAQIRVTNTVDFKSKSTVFLCLSASKFIAILQILCKIKVEVHMDLVSAINFYPADKLADDHLFCFKAGTIVQVCVRDQFFVQLRCILYNLPFARSLCWQQTKFYRSRRKINGIRNNFCSYVCFGYYFGNDWCDVFGKAYCFQYRENV